MDNLTEEQKRVEALEKALAVAVAMFLTSGKPHSAPLHWMPFLLEQGARIESGVSVEETIDAAIAFWRAEQPLH